MRCSRGFIFLKPDGSGRLLLKLPPGSPSCERDAESNGRLAGRFPWAGQLPQHPRHRLLQARVGYHYIRLGRGYDGLELLFQNGYQCLCC